MPPFVIKYGSSVLRDADCLAGVAADIALNATNAAPVIVVVSAFAGRTDELCAEARRRGLDEASPAYADIIGAGEFECAVELLRVLKEWDVSATIATPRRICFTAEGPRCDAEPKLLDCNAVAGILERTPILIMPGFSAIDANGDPMLLGRGGSDLTAVHLAARMGSDTVRLIKDVDAVYDRDPNLHEGARRQLRLDYETALDIAGKLIQPKALLHARAHGVSIEIGALGEPPGTLISA